MYIDFNGNAVASAFLSGGYITSDSDSVADAVDTHHYVSDAGNASCMAVRDGGDDIDSGACVETNASLYSPSLLTFVPSLS